LALMTMFVVPVLYCARSEASLAFDKRSSIDGHVRGE